MQTRTWPGTPAERADRHKVLDLLQVVGRRQLCWSVTDVQRAMRDIPRLALECPRQLGRHIADLVPLTVRTVGQPVAAIATAGAAPKTRHLYILAERESELAGAPLPLLDPVRVYLALWVACRVAGGDAVETNAVTRVCRSIEALAVDDRVQMSTRLASLVDRGQPLVALVAPAAAAGVVAGRWRRWQPLGTCPAMDEMDAWVTSMAALETDRPPASRVGHVTLHDIAAELVAIAITRTISTAWPSGRSVTVTDISAARGEDPRARELDAVLRRRGSSLGRVLGDASKARIAGRARVSLQVVKVGTVAGEQTYYDLPGRPGFDARTLYVPVQQVSVALRDATLDALARESADVHALAARADQNPGHDGAVLGAIAAVRALLMHEELQILEARIASVETQTHLLSETTRKGWRQRVGEFNAVRRKISGDVAEATERATAATAALGLELCTLLGTPRPLLVGVDFERLVPGAAARGRTAAGLIADATTLRRFPNPAHTHRKDPDPRQAAVTGVDRVDALVALAEKLGADTLTFLDDGATLLGRDLREPTLPRLLLRATDPRLRTQALAALALLDDASAEPAALAVLAERPNDVRSAARALQALAVLGKAEPLRWPVWLRETREPSLVRSMQLLLNLPRDTRWLMRRIG